MQLVSNEIASYAEKSSQVRKMFEAAIALKGQYGAENVYDFSLGNPDLPPPENVKEALHKIADEIHQPFSLGYMPNAGYPELREKLAGQLSAEQNFKISAENLVISCGAAGAINSFFRAVCSPGEEIIAPAPCFVEYFFYAANYGATLKPVAAADETFALDIAAIDAAINEKTRAILINSPNNPTGRIYSGDELDALAQVMKKHNAKREQPLYLVSDEPYRFLNYTRSVIPSVFSFYEHSVIVSSYSKSLSMAGARIGYFVANPAMDNVAQLVNAVIMTTRILGYVNAPAIAQKVLMHCCHCKVDANIYRSRRDAMAGVLDRCGIEYFMPQGAFYFFAKSPLADDAKFCAHLQKYRILAVPGSAFCGPGYFRLTFCVSEKIIEKSTPAFVQAMKNI